MPDNINSKNSDSCPLFEKTFVKTLEVSVVMAVFLVDMGLGLFDILSNKASPLPLALIFLIFAVMFIAGLVFYERSELDMISSLIGGAFAGFGLSFVLIALVGGVQFLMDGGIFTLGWEQITSAVAVCMVASVVMLRIFSYKLDDHFF